MGLRLLADVSRRDPDHALGADRRSDRGRDRKSTRLNSSHLVISYAVFCLKKKNNYATPSIIVMFCITSSVAIHPTLLTTHADARQAIIDSYKPFNTQLCFSSVYAST